MSETKKRNVKVVESKTLSSRYDRRFVIVDEETENVLDDAQGYGYKSKQKLWQHGAIKTGIRAKMRKSAKNRE